MSNPSKIQNPWRFLHSNSRSAYRCTQNSALTNDREKSEGKHIHTDVEQILRKFIFDVNTFHANISGICFRYRPTTPFSESSIYTGNSFARDKLNNSIFYWVPCKFVEWIELNENERTLPLVLENDDKSHFSWKY